MKKIIAANWKDNGSKDFIKKYFDYFLINLDSENEIVIFPPDLYIDQVNKFKDKNNFSIGGQKLSDRIQIINDRSEYNVGPLTSGNYPEMFSDNGCDYILYGHSEVRATWYKSDVDGFFGESLSHYQRDNLQVIFCVGESDDVKKKGYTQRTLSIQLNPLCNERNNLFKPKKAIIAYEPIWAIGTGNIPKVDDISFIHRFIKTYVSENHPFLKEEDIMVLYGGSVNSKNAKEILNTPDVDGVLIGGASLDAKEFTKICNLKI